MPKFLSGPIPSPPRLPFPSLYDSFPPFRSRPLKTARGLGSRVWEIEFGAF